MSYIGLEMIKLGIGSVLVAVAMSACSTAAERASFAMLDEDSGTPSAQDDKASGDSGSDSSASDTPESDAGDAGNPDDGSVGDDAEASVCDGLPPPTATSDDCVAVRRCYDCGDNSFIYRCMGKTTNYVPPNMHCSTTSDTGEVCCQAACTRMSLSDNVNCTSPFSKAWSCANVNAESEPIVKPYGCSHVKTSGMVATMCCQATVEPEWQ